jgi:hypothetical protein
MIEEGTFPDRIGRLLRLEKAPTLADTAAAQSVIRRHRINGACTGLHRTYIDPIQ